MGNSKGLSKIHDSVHEGTKKKKLMKENMGKSNAIFMLIFFFFFLLKLWNKTPSKELSA